MKDKSIFKDFKSEPPKVFGRSTINHEARMELMLNCSEYVFMDWFYREVSKGKEPEILDCYVNTGFTGDQQQRLMKSLITKGFLIPTNDDSPKLTSKWESGFADLDKEFEVYFWKQDGKVCWNGSKPNALKLYVKLRKNISRDFLLKQRNTYFKYLECEHKLGFQRPKLMCSVFLGPQERFNEDWKGQLEEAQAKLNAREAEYTKREGAKAMTQDEMKNLYGKDNPQ